LKFVVTYRGVNDFLQDKYDDHNYVIEGGILRVRWRGDKGMYKEVKVYKDWVHLKYGGIDEREV
jgi:hypothetical protein